MIRNYLTLVFRDLKKSPGFYLTNIISLAIGIAACLMIAGYVKFHRSFDTQSPEYADTYRIQYSRWGQNDDKVEFASASPTIGPAIKENFPEAINYARAYKFEGVFFSGTEFFKEDKVFRSESSIFTILGIPIIKGDKLACLDDPSSVVISESTAIKYFGDNDPIGKTISVNKRQNLIVKAVFRDLPENMHIKADIFISLAEWMQQDPQIFSSGWFYSGFFTYVQFIKGTDPNKIDEGIAKLIEKEFGETLDEYKMGMSFKLQPLNEIHLNSHFMHELETNGTKSSIDLLEIVGWFLLIIAWVNFFNLSTIASLRKQREIAIRKTNGATRLQLVGQLLIWSAVINLAALMVALTIFEMTLPLFNRFTGIPSGAITLQSGLSQLIILIAFIVGTLSAGIYSVTGIYSSQIINILKGGKSIQKKGILMKKGLVTLQYVIGISLIAATIGVYLQFHLLSQRNPGFSLDNILVVKAPAVGDSTLINRFKTFTDQVTAMPGIEGCAFSSVIPGQSNMFNRGGIYQYGQNETDAKNYRVTETAESFFDTYNIRFISGEGFTGNKGLDQQRVVINAYAAQCLGFSKPEEAIGKKIMMEGRPFMVSGVVIDFLQRSSKEAIEPQIFRHPQRFNGHFSINTGKRKPDDMIHEIGEKYKAIFNDNPYEASFLKNYYDLQFEQEKRYSGVFAIFSLLVIFITVLGLTGLSAYTAEQRRKEIGIRKTLGASDWWLFYLLFTDYIWLCILAALVALPLFHYKYNEWLSGFALQLTPQWWLYLIPVTIVLLISVITVWIQSKRIIRENPVENLKYE